MAKKKSYITVTDQFCGAGGSSQGADEAISHLGGEIVLALNHWKLAIETHNSNFPNAIHECTDVQACDPRRYPSTDILITSPECTNHSLAKGKKRVKATLDMFNKGLLDVEAIRSRATMWDVPRFAEYHQYRFVIVENVVDARKWIQFDAWLMAMHLLGYEHKCVYLNSMFCHPTPQSRDRMYVVFWRRGMKAPNLNFTPEAFCYKCDKIIQAVQTWKKSYIKYGVYGKRGQYLYSCPSCASIVEPFYYAAFNCIDWSDLGQRIGDRKKPLSKNTLTRIEYGLDKYGNQVMQVTNKNPGFCKPVTNASGTVLTVNGHALLTPFVVNDQQSTGVGFRVKPVHKQLHTMATENHSKLILPFLIKMEHMKMKSMHRSSADAMQTQLTRQSQVIVNMPYIVPVNKTGKAKPAVNPTQTFTSKGINHALMISPLIIDENYDPKKSRAKQVTKPMNVMNTQNRTVIAFPFVVENKGQSKSRVVLDPLSTATTTPYHGLITTDAWNSFININRKQHPSGISQPVPTVATIEQLSMVNFQKPRIEDCYYRMLKPDEIKGAMAFRDNYIVLGSGKQQVKQLGNAVTPPAMKWLVERCVETL